jgi:hypothetical protein
MLKELHLTALILQQLAKLAQERLTIKSIYCYNLRVLMKLWTFFYLAILFFVLFPKPAFAYLDPSTGSYLFQFLIAGLLGGVFFMKGYFSKLKKFSGKIF